MSFKMNLLHVSQKVKKSSYKAIKTNQKKLDTIQCHSFLGLPILLIY